LLVVFSRPPKLLGYWLLNSEQIRFFIGHLDGSMRLAFAFGVGSLLLVLELLRDRSRVAPASIDLLVATTCGIPLILLVEGVGETPRHYIAEVGLITLVATVGWYHGLQRLRERDWPGVAALFVLAGITLALTAAASLSQLTPLRLIVGSVGAVMLTVAAIAILRWLNRQGRLAVFGTLVATVI